MTPGLDAIDRVVGSLSCPVCRSAVERDASTLRCARGHSFDIARQGHVSLFDGGRRSNTGDTAAMVAARDRFLAGGHYAPIADAVADAVTVSGPPDRDGAIADLAGGTGYYLARVLGDGRRWPGISIDLSAAASRRAARAHPAVAAVASDVWGRLPLADGSCSVVLSIFGPRNGPEILRVLRTGGVLVVVSPAADHLRELVDRLHLLAVDPRKRERLDHRLAGLTRRSTRSIHYRTDMTADDIADEVAMGPSAYHVDLARLPELLGPTPTPVAVTVSVEVSVWASADAAIRDVDEMHNGSR